MYLEWNDVLIFDMVWRENSGLRCGSILTRKWSWGPFIFITKLDNFRD